MVDFVDCAFFLVMIGFILYYLIETLTAMVNIGTLMAWIIPALLGVNAFYNSNNNDDDDIHHDPTMGFMAEDAEFEQEEEEQGEQNTLTYRILWLLTPNGLIFLMKCPIRGCCMVVVWLCIAVTGWLSFIIHELPIWAAFLILLTTAIICGLIADLIKRTLVAVFEAIKAAFWWMLYQTGKALKYIVILVVWRAPWAILCGASNMIRFFCRNVWNIVWNLMKLTGRKVQLMFVAQQEQQNEEQQQPSWFQRGIRLFGLGAVQENNRRYHFFLHQHLHHRHHRFPHRHRHIHRPPVPVTNPAAIAVAAAAAAPPSAERTRVPMFHDMTNTTFILSVFSATSPASTAAVKPNPQNSFEKTVIERKTVAKPTAAFKENVARLKIERKNKAVPGSKSNSEKDGNNNSKCTCGFFVCSHSSCQHGTGSSHGHADFSLAGTSCDYHY